jgi:hypothetical protein
MTLTISALPTMTLLRQSCAVDVDTAVVPLPIDDLIKDAGRVIDAPGVLLC